MIEYLLRLLKLALSWVLSLWRSIFGPIIKFDNGTRVRILENIAEGGFSTVFLAVDVDQKRTHRSTATRSVIGFSSNYALKRIRCHDSESRNACLKESKVHYAIMEEQKKRRRHQGSTNANIISAGGGGGGGISASTEIAMESVDEALSSHFMPLLGTTFSADSTFCFLLFPNIPHSLKKEVEKRIFEPFEEMTNGNSGGNSNNPKSQFHQNQKIKDALMMAPWSEGIVLQWFEQLIDAVILMHDAGFSHRDIKLDNVLLHPEPPPVSTSSTSQQNLFLDRSRSGPVLMDFGSAGPLTTPLTTRREVLLVADEAASHTTISYRPPELWAGELRVAEHASVSASTRTNNETINNDDEVDNDLFLDYRKVDVWMLGCTLFAILFGASPGEVEFSRSTGKMNIVDPSHNKVLGAMPWPGHDTPTANWYSTDLKELLEWILTQNRRDRPNIKKVRQRVREILTHQPTFFKGDIDMQHGDV